MYTGIHARYTSSSTFVRTKWYNTHLKENRTVENHFQLSPFLNSMNFFKFFAISLINQTKRYCHSGYLHFITHYLHNCHQVNSNSFPFKIVVHLHLRRELVNPQLRGNVAKFPVWRQHRMCCCLFRWHSSTAEGYMC
jgi:hypothetical protein